MYRHAVLLSVLLAVLVSFAACDLDNANPEDVTDTAPDPPSTEVFTLNADLFRPSGGKHAAKIHYANAALRVWPVSAILSANLVIPVAVTGSALNAEPVFEDGVWHWRNTTTAEGVTFDYDLAATVRLSTIDWSMRITSSRAVAGQLYNDFELYTATTALNGQNGSWRLFYLIDGESTNILNATFQLLDGGAKEVIYTLGDGLDQSGDTVRYLVDGNARGFLWTQLREALTHDVNWDAGSKEGAIVATNYQNGERGCWDDTFEDVTCP